ncbi:nitric oxide synthase-interacting protein-like [Dysidea avara]|uniref:nitric oxide synthase-interacting protein-like n=1 Tax=Dysidea avara TaxID=196820 RepID=UPI0033310D7A
MTRHGKNATASAVYTYHEKRKDTSKSGYGTKYARLGKDSVKEFDCCGLTLQPCKDPVITPQGYLYDKEAILECLLHQKRENARKLKEYEKQKKKHESEKEELGKAEARAKMEKFLASEGGVTSKPSTSDKGSKDTSTPAIQHEDLLSSASGSSSKPKLPSFWVPALTPDAKPTEIKKPDSKTYCPTSGSPLRVKDLVTVKFTPIADRDGKSSLISKGVRYMCAVTHDALGNSVPCAVLRPSGDVVTLECVEKVIKKDMICPITSQKLKESDIIVMERGASGFAGSGIKLDASKKGAVMMV